MNDQELLRYSRQIMLPEIDYQGQLALKQSRVLLVGLGGLGSPIALYLAAAGVGHLVLNDFDQVELTNLQRQIIHSNNSLGEDKVISAKNNLLNLNPEIKISTYNQRLSEPQLCEQIELADVVIDASDNFASRFLINKISFKTSTPLVSGAAIQFEGQVSVFNQTKNSPCYQCLYKDTGADTDLSCSANGVLGPLLGVIGGMQAIESIKILTGVGDTLDGRLLLFDAKRTEWRQLKLNKDPACEVCHHP